MRPQHDHRRPLSPSFRWRDQILHRRHRADDAFLLDGIEPFEHCGDLVVRTLVEWREGLAALGGDRDQALSRIVRCRLAGDEAVLGEAPQDAAEIAGVEPEVGGERSRGDRLTMCKLPEDARLGHRESGVEEMLVQQADLARVEAGEAAHGGDATLQVG